MSASTTRRRWTRRARVDRTLENYTEIAEAVRVLPGVAHAAAVVRGQVMASHQGRNAGVEVIGIAPEDLARVPLVAEPEGRARRDRAV